MLWDSFTQQETLIAIQQDIVNIWLKKQPWLELILKALAEFTGMPLILQLQASSVLLHFGFLEVN